MSISNQHKKQSLKSQSMKRTVFYIVLFSIFIFACTKTEEKHPSEDPLRPFYNQDMSPFYFGVASGDPLKDRVIIWTKVEPNGSNNEVEWEVSSDENFTSIVNSGIAKIASGDNYTIKVDADNLEPSTYYYYRFKYNERYSPTGRTKTASTDSDSLKFAVVSCSNYEFGYFNAYRGIANRNDIDAVLHLGDYIYEYASGIYRNSSSDRKHIPQHELISLEDYRIRYGQYRLDSDLQAAHQYQPFITIWDDHEIANNAYKDGAQNHQEEEGAYETRKAAARKAYYEWLPVRESPTLYRKFDYGKLAEVIMLDERLEGRTEPVDTVDNPFIADSSRTMLGSKQLQWFENQLVNSNSTWKLIGNQVIYSYLNWGFPSWKINMDSWDGYPIERTHIKQTILENEIENVVFVTGDTHSSWAFEVTDDPFINYDSATSEGAFALEFGTTSINSGNSDENMSADTVRRHEKKITNTALNPHLKFANLRDHGYLLITLTEESVRAQWYYVESVLDQNSSEYLGKEVSVPAGSVDIR